MNDVDVDGRASPSTPSPPPPLKRAKTERYDPTLYCYDLPLTAPRGVERIPFSASLNPNRLSSQYLTQLTSERSNFLRGQGRRVVGLPLVLNDGIVLNWVRDQPSAIGGVRSQKVDDKGPVVRQSAVVRKRLHFPIISTGSGSGTSAFDAIVIASDDEKISRVSGTSTANAIVVDADDDCISGVSCLFRTDSKRKPPINHSHGTSSNKGEIDFSDSDMELPLANSRNDVEDDPEDSPPAAVSEPIPLDPPPRRAFMRDDNTVALSRRRSDNANVTISQYEVDRADRGVNGVEDVNGSRISTPLSLPSLKPIRQLLARGKRRVDPEGDAPPQRTILAPIVSKKQGRAGFLEESPAITSSESEEELDCPPSDPQLKRVPLPKTNHGRARRLLLPESADLPLVAVTMRGDCHFIERKKKYRISGYSLPNPGVYRHVGDVCMVGNIAVLGCDKGTHQISFLSVMGRPRMIDVTCSPHSSGPRYQDMEKRGVSRLAAIHAEDGHIKFLSGGYDGTIHMWTAGIERLNEPCSRKVVSHGASIMALAYRDRDRSVVASAQKRLHITDLNRCKTMTHPVSNDIRQIHIHPQAANLTLLEVRHLDRQIHLYDSRKGGFDSEPCLSFGHRNANGHFSRTHTRGSVHLVHFAMASEDRGVLLWDFRNSKRAVIERRFQQAEKVVHTIFADSDIATFGQGVVTFFEDYLAQ